MSVRLWIFWLACIIAFVLAFIQLLKFGTWVYVPWLISVGIGVAAAQSLRKEDR